MGCTSRHLSLPVSATSRFTDVRMLPSSSPTWSSAAAKGVYGSDAKLVVRSRSSYEEDDVSMYRNSDGDGRRKKYVRGMTNGMTDDRPTPTRTPKPRISHQRNAPTSPAAPVPEAKYLCRGLSGRQRKHGDRWPLTLR